MQEVFDMLVERIAVEPIQREDGRWTVEERVHKIDLPTDGRTPDMCNWCGKASYPECKSKCEFIRPESR